MTTNQEIKVLIDKTTFIQKQNEALQKDVNSLKDLIAANDKRVKDLLQKETSERQEDVNMLKEKINKKENQINEVSE